MIIGVPKEIKVHEYRVGMVPASVHELVKHGHEVWVQKDAGLGIGCTDQDYQAVGAKIVDTPEEIFAKVDMVVKVKEPQSNECKMMRPDQILFTYLHLAADRTQTDLLLDSGCVAIAYETVTDKVGRLPLLAPMSEVAGRLSIQAGAQSLEKKYGGRGVLLSGVPGVKPADVTIIGGGVVGINAMLMAVGLGAHVTVLDRNLPRLRELNKIFSSKVNTIFINDSMVEQYVCNADLVVGAVLVPGGAAPKLVTRDRLSRMRKGAVIVDVSIDQGGCFETSRPTTHAEPTYIVDDIVHYCVTNMPGAVPRTSAFALNNATLPFIIALADKGYKQALTDDAHLMNGLNVCQGKVTHKAVADAFGLAFTAPKTVL